MQVFKPFILFISYYLNFFTHLHYNDRNQYFKLFANKVYNTDYSSKISLFEVLQLSLCFI